MPRNSIKSNIYVVHACIFTKLDETHNNVDCTNSSRCMQTSKVLFDSFQGFTRKYCYKWKQNT